MPFSAAQDANSLPEVMNLLRHPIDQLGISKSKRLFVILKGQLICVKAPATRSLSKIRGLVIRTELAGGQRCLRNQIAKQGLTMRIVSGVQIAKVCVVP